MERRQFLSVACGLGLAPFARVAQNDAKRRAQAIAEGKTLTVPGDGLVKVAIAVTRGATWIDFVGPATAFETWYYDSSEKKYRPRFKMFFVSDNLEPQDNLVADYTFENAPHANVILVPAQSGSDGLIRYLQNASKSADITMSVCTGAWHLAKSGLLDGMKATTHHEALEKFSKSFPNVQWIRGVRFVEHERISTGGGLTAGIDLGLRVVERYFGRKEAIQVAAHMEYEGKGWIV